VSILDDLTAAASHDLPEADVRQLALVIQAHEPIDGIDFDLAVTWRDARGCLWWWTQRRDDRSRAVMVSSLGEEAPLENVYLAHAPLVGQPPRLTGAAFWAAIGSAPFGGAA
jgi:hypothetical protein